MNSHSNYQQPSTGQFAQSNPSLLEDAELALTNLSHQEIQLIKETEELFKQQVNYMVQIDRLRQHIPNMKNISDHTKKLSSLVDSSFVLVGEVCSKFRQIDLAKSRLEDSLSKIGDILDLKTCRDGIKEAMQSNNYEQAAMHINRFLSIDQKELQKTIFIICEGEKAKKFQTLRNEAIKTFGRNATMQLDGDISSVKQQSEESTTIDPNLINTALKELDEAKKQLLCLCQENLTGAIKMNETKTIERFFKIFPMLGEHHDGLQRYSTYIKSKIINAQLDSTINSKEVNQADKLAALFENVAKLVDIHQPIIETYYGPGHLIVVTRIVQKECDRLSRKILEEFRNETNLQHVAKVVRSSSHLPLMINAPSASTNNPQEANNLNLSLSSKLDPRTLDKILSEISMIVSRSGVFLSFITKRIQDDINLKTDDEARRKTSQIELYNFIHLECELNHLIQEVGGIYVMLEQFYLNESSKKAILMDQIDTDPSLGTYVISSMLDDIFFIIKKCTKRAISTKSIEVFCAIINHCVTFLESTFCQIVEDRLKNQQYFARLTAKNLDFSQAYNALQSGRYLRSVNDQRKSNGQYFSALNNLDKACDYIKTLRSMLESDVRRLKPATLVTEAQHDNQLEKSITCLNELSRLVGKFTSIINSTLYQLFNTSLRGCIKAELKMVIDEDPGMIRMVTKSNPNELTSLAEGLLRTSDDSLKESMTPQNYSKLVSITKDFLASTINVQDTLS